MSLLSECTSGGCGAKIGPGELGPLLASLPKNHDPALLVGFDASDDAAVYKVSEGVAIVETVDFFTPMVDDAKAFGAIAAANALSDVYAMGAKPLFALNLVCFPQKMDKAILADILAAGAGKVAEAGAVIAGGHSIYDHEPKYGLAVTGMAHPDKILMNNTCKEGDALILTKALGVGLLMSAARVGLVGGEVDAALASMQRLNKYAAEKMAGFPVSACTDITGFGLAAHAAEMAGEAHTIYLDAASLPLLPGALFAAGEFLATAAGQRNRNHMAGRVDVSALSPAMSEVVFDPQTSGGLLISVPAAEADALCAAIRKDDPAAAVIGTVAKRDKVPVVVL